MSTTEQLNAALAGRYIVERLIGEGGMATVYLARDLKHNRKVALKVLKPDLGAVVGVERFLSEIQVTANLQHPNLLPLFDSGEAQGLLFYVMPFVEGESLRARLEREKQLPVDDAVHIATAVASALDYAHRHGVIHRDLKPENILLHEGEPLVADFGIALALTKAGDNRITQTGISLGTPAYMSPEQATSDRVIDARSDIYSLGAVTYEMLTGESPHFGSTSQAIIARLLTEKPRPVSASRPSVPPHVEAAIGRALEKLRADRWSTAKEFAEALGPAPIAAPATRGEVAFQAIGAGAGTSSREVRRLRNIAIMGWGAAAVLAAVPLWGWLRAVTPKQPVTRVAISLPAGQTVQPFAFGYSLDVSRDGSRVAYVGPGLSSTSTQLWVRPLDALQATAVPGTTGARSVRWSPDGRFLFFSGAAQSPSPGSVVAVDGGQVVSLAGAAEATWGGPNRLYYLRGSVIERRTVGGAVDTVYRGDSTFARAHSITVLPDESGALLSRHPKDDSDRSAEEILSVSFKTGKLSVVGPGIPVRYVNPGHLIYVSSAGDAFVAPFDPGSLRMTGPGVPVARVAMANLNGRPYPQISVSDEGTLIYLAGELHRQRLVWLSASGRVEDALPIEGNLWGVKLSPDGSRVAFAVRLDERTPSSGNSDDRTDVWVADVRTGARTRLTSDLFNARPSWSADGKYVLWARVGGPYKEALVERRADASDSERVVLTMADFRHSLGDGRWLPDHRTLIASTYGADDRGIYYFTPGTDTAAHPFAASTAAQGARPVNQVGPYPSPDGSQVAYISSESGTTDLYVKPFPSGGEHLTVARNVASYGRWSRDGRQLYFWDERGKLMVATIQARPQLAVLELREVGGDFVLGSDAGASGGLFDVAPDGRILAAEAVPGSFDVIVVRNWMAGLTTAAKK